LCSGGVAESVVVDESGIDGESWQPTIVPSQKVIPEWSGWSFKVPEKVGSVCSHLEESKFKHPVLLFDGGVRFISGKDGIHFVCNRPFSNHGGKGLIGDKRLIVCTCNLGMNCVIGSSKIFVKAMVNVNIEDDVLVCRVVHEASPLLRLESMIHDNCVSGGRKVISKLSIQVQVKVLDSSQLSLDSPRKGFIQDSKSPDGSVDEGVILKFREPLSHTNSEGGLFVDCVSGSKTRGFSNLSTVIPSVLRSDSSMNFNQRFNVVLMQQPQNSNQVWPLSSDKRFVVRI